MPLRLRVLWRAGPASNVGLAVTIAFVLMWLLMLGQVPLAAVMGLTGVVGSALFIGFAPAISAFATEATTFLTNTQVATLPLFLMMGSFAAVSGMADDMYRLGHVLLSRRRGGLALATIGGCAGFGALTGSSLATAATIGRVAIPEMRARGYSPALATGCCAAGGTLGPIVPPGSGPIIVFALLTEASIGQLFVASVGPAILTILFYFITVMLYVRLAPGLGARRPRARAGRAARNGAALHPGRHPGRRSDGRALFRRVHRHRVGGGRRLRGVPVRRLARQAQGRRLPRRDGRDHRHHRDGLLR